VNWILVKNTVQRLLTRPVTLALILAYGLYTLATVGIQAAAAQNQVLVQNFPGWAGGSKAAWFLVWVLGSGLLGQERTAGFLPLLLSRPISRAQYVLSRWLGLVISVVLLDFGVTLVALLWLATKHQLPDASDILMRWAWFAGFTLCASAWLTLLSASFGGHGDFFYFVAVSLVAYLVGVNTLGQQGLQSAHQILAWFWTPGDSALSFAHDGDTADAVYAALAFLAGAAACLGLAAWIMRRRDISYVNR
jgi:ABC-type transport system involved in multi-copper enzyme maturation permease subunit